MKKVFEISFPDFDSLTKEDIRRYLHSMGWDSNNFDVKEIPIQTGWKETSPVEAIGAMWGMLDELRGEIRTLKNQVKMARSGWPVDIESRLKALEIRTEQLPNKKDYDHERRIKNTEARLGYIENQMKEVIPGPSWTVESVIKSCPYCGVKPLVWDYENTVQCSWAECLPGKQMGKIPYTEWQKRAGNR